MDVIEQSEQVERNEVAAEFSFDKVIHSLPLEAKESISKALNFETRRLMFHSSETLILASIGTSSEQRSDFLLQNFPDLSSVKLMFLEEHSSQWEPRTTWRRP
jgi:hypothetical protein